MIALQSSKSATLSATASTSKAHPIRPMSPHLQHYSIISPSSTANKPLVPTKSSAFNIQRRCSSSSETNTRRGSVKALTTQRSFPHLPNKKSWKRRGSDTSNKTSASSTATYINTAASDSDLTLELMVDKKCTTQSATIIMDSSPAIVPLTILPAGDLIHYASRKRNKDFHSLFEGLSDDERLIDDYGCALQREILAQGKMYISEDHLCFYANIFGWITNLVIDFRDIELIEKRSTAIIVPNAICITVGSTKYFFGSFISRDQAYDLLVELWNNAQMKCNTTNALRTVSHCNKVGNAIGPTDSAMDGTSETIGDDESGYTSSFDCSDCSDHELDEHEHLIVRNNAKIIDQNSVSSLKTTENQISLDMTMTINDATTRCHALSETGARDINMKEDHKTTIEKLSPETTKCNDMMTTAKSASSTDITTTNATAEKTTASAKAMSDSALNKTSTSTHQIKSITECECSIKNEHFPIVVLDSKYKTDLRTIYELLFVTDFMEIFLNNDQKLSDVSIGAWSIENNNCRERQTSYVKPLNNALGPKQTRCILTEQIQHEDTTDYITHLSVCRTPDVPSGGSFLIKTRTCISWCAQGQVRVLVTVSVEFTKTCWIKGTIEKASIEGQQKFYTELDIALQEHLSRLAKTEQQQPGQQAAVIGKRKSARHRQKRRHLDANSTHQQQLPIRSPSTKRLSFKLAAVKQPKEFVVGHTVSRIVNWFLNKEFTIPHQFYVVILLMIVLCQIYTGMIMASLNNQIDRRCNAFQMPGAARSVRFSPLFAEQD
ncbi:hypothetical protein BDF20DRAFT_916554 [Mycotypha africana]|uniref:uncharacterized protein n=1 Tax=Mycotypha africana TaxID=64632 RepID=UPI0023003304|nr:uncharacterized protein BDF20DRAFT_916554 [Mycotypha africana]KAI8969175.1 hypothetical protein BDF20DRAFT_916554 [Mycotypha africana]